MKKLKRFWLNIPRKMRICINVLAIFALLMAVYIFGGCPAFTVEHQFRRLEKANLVGPSEIIEIIELEDSEYDRLVVGDDGDGVILYCCNLPGYRWDWGNFFYREKSDGMTIAAMPSRHFGTFDHTLDLPILLLHDYHGAVRAELELTLGKAFEIQETVTRDGIVMLQDFEKTYFLEATSDKYGYFRFTLHAAMEPGDSHQTLEDTVEGQALKRFARMFADNGMYLKEYVPATVRLYDRNDNLIIEEHLTIRSVAGERYAREEGINE